MSDRNLAETAAQRGNNLVCFAPPSPSSCRSALRGVLNRTDPMHPGPFLALAPAEAIEEWARVAAQTAGKSGAVLAARGTARLLRLVQTPGPKLGITSPSVAHELVRKAALKPQELAGIVLLWPEGWSSAELVTELLQEIPRETQRILVTSDPVGQASWIERYCWRAAVADLLGPLAEGAPWVQTVPVAWGRRSEAVVDLVEQLNPDSLWVWIADASDAGSIEATLGGTGTAAIVGSELPGRPALVVAYDLPSPEGLRRLGEAGQVVLLVPPGTEAYVSRLAPLRKPLHLSAALAAAEAELSADRRAIAEAVDAAPGAAAFHAINPLLERHEATAVAAALYRLWKDARSTGGATPPALRPAQPRLWMGIGKRDSVSANELVAALIKHGGVPREAIGKIEIRESYSLIELGAGADPATVAERLAGQTIRRRRLVAKLDQGLRGR